MRVAHNSTDLTGKKFNRLLVLSKAENGGKDNKISFWNCRCDCGVIKRIRTSQIKNGHTKSCGCWNLEQIRNRNFKKNPSTTKLGFGTAAFNRVFKFYKKNAEKAGREFSLSRELFYELIKQDCYYCGATPTNMVKNTHKNGHCLYNGLDRLDSTKGYTENNVVPCCVECNFMKKNMTSDKFVNQIITIYNHIILNKPISIYGEIKMCGML